MPSEGVTSFLHAHSRKLGKTHTRWHAHNITVFQDVCVQVSTAHWPLYQSSSQKAGLKTNVSTPPLFLYPNRRLCNKTFHFSEDSIYTTPSFPPPGHNHGSLQVPLELKPFRVSVKKEGGSHNVPSPPFSWTQDGCLLYWFLWDHLESVDRKNDLRNVLSEESRGNTS